MLTPEERIRAAFAALQADPKNPDRARELCAAICAWRNRYEELRDVCGRINARGGET